jgi:hypothetical protein
VLDVVAWHAAARADRILVVHADGSATEVSTSDPVASVAAVRAAAASSSGTGLVDVREGSKVFAATVDATRLAALVPSTGDESSVALLVDGPAPAPWLPTTAADLAAGLVPLA